MGFLEYETERRGFVKAFAGVGAYEAVGGNTAETALKIFEEAASRLLASPEQENPLEPTVIENISVFGHDKAIDSQKVFEAIRNQEEEKTFPGITTGLTVVPGLRREQILTSRKEILPPNKRFLEFVILESVYKRIPEVEDVKNFVVLAKNHVAAFNQILTDNVPDIQIEIVLKRIIVVSDKLAPEPKTKPEEQDKGWVVGFPPEGHPDHKRWQHDNFGRLPTDVDLRWFLEKNYLETKKRIRNFKIEGKKVPINSDLIHDWFHCFFFLPDLYWYYITLLTPSEEKFLQNPILAYKEDIMCDPSASYLSPASAVLVKTAVNRFGLRSTQTDDRPENLKSIRPKSAMFTFTLPDQNRPEIVKCFGSKQSSEDFWTHWRERKDVQIPLPDEVWQPEKGVIQPNKKQLENVCSFIIVNLRLPEEEKPFPFLIPYHLMVLTNSQLIINPAFNIQLMPDKIKNSDEQKQIVLKMIWKKDLESYLDENKQVFAYCHVPATEAIQIWEWERETSPTIRRGMVCAYPLAFITTILLLSQVEKILKEK